MGSLIKIWKTLPMPAGAKIGRNGTVTWLAKGKKKTGKLSSIVTFAFSRIGGLDRDYFVRIWDTETGKELRKLEGHTAPVRHAAFSPDGTKIVTGGNDRSVCIWDAESGNEVQKLDVPMAIVNRVDFSPDGKKVVATMRDSYRDHVIRIWTLE